MTTAKPRSGVLWVLLSAFALVGFGSFFFPAFVIRPFTHQSPSGLYWAMAIRQQAPIISLVCAVACVVLVMALWQISDKWRKGVLSAVMLLVTAAAVMSRLNYFEWMFHPVDAAQFEAQSSSKLDGLLHLERLRIHLPALTIIEVNQSAAPDGSIS